MELYYGISLFVLWQRKDRVDRKQFCERMKFAKMRFDLRRDGFLHDISQNKAKPSEKEQRMKISIKQAPKKIYLMNNS